MSLIRSTNTKPEIALRKILNSNLYARGYRYRLHYKKLSGRPDVVFVAQKVAIFIDGSFWHGYRFRKGQTNLSRDYWLPKIKRNMQRDKEVNKKLKKMEWNVIRIWEHDIKKHPEKIVDKVLKSLKEHA